MNFELIYLKKNGSGEGDASHILRGKSD